MRPEYRSQYGDSLRARQFRARTPVEARNFLLSTPVQTALGAYPASCTMVYWLFAAVKAAGGGDYHPLTSTGGDKNK
jgi:hypothetical protein